MDTITKLCVGLAVAVAVVSVVGLFHMSTIQASSHAIPHHNPCGEGKYHIGHRMTSWGEEQILCH